jgi:hypothetical protein
MPEPIFMKLGTYITEPEPVSPAQSKYPSHQSVYPPIFARQRLGNNPPIVARQRLGKNVTAATNTRNNRRIVGRVVFYVARVVSRKVGV